MTSVTSKDINHISGDTFARILAGPPEDAAHWLRTAAKGGVTEAQAVYGQILLDGKGCPRDPRRAVFWFERASKKNHPMALNMLGQCHQHGWGVPVNLLLATYWFRLAAKAGLDWGMYNYATALSLGSGAAQDRAKALVWFRKAADLGHAKSINMIGSFYEDGWEIEQDLDQALAYYRRAALGGDFRGQFNCARLLASRGQLQSALAWLEKVPDTATAAFLEKARDFLIQSGIPPLQDMGRSFQTILMQRERSAAAARTQ